MGSRWCAWCLTAVAVFGSRASLAEDIGREPLAPMQRPAVVGAAGAAGGERPPQGSAGADTPPSKGATPRRQWYGWQTLIADAVSGLGLIVVATDKARSDADSVVIPLVTVYFLGGPVVHAAHGHVGKAFLSLGVRSLGPLLVALGASSSHGDDGGGPALEAIGVLCIPAAIAIDAAAIAREDVTPQEASLLHRVAAAPWVDPKRGAAGVSAIVSF